MAVAGSEVASDGSTTPPTTTLDVISAVATCLSGLAAIFNNSFRLFVFGLAAVNGVLLLIVALMRIKSRLKNKKHRLPLAFTIASICVVALAMSGWSLVHSQSSTVEQNTQEQPAAKIDPPAERRVYNSVTNDKNSPVFNGNNNTYNSTDSASDSKKKRR